MVNARRSHHRLVLSTDASTQFFQELAARGHEPMLEKVTGTLRFDLTDEERTTRWLVSISKGDVDVAKKNAKADCIVRVDHTTFDGIASGELNAMEAFLRGLLMLRGDQLWLLLPFQRLFPGPPRKES